MENNQKRKLSLHQLGTKKIEISDKEDIDIKQYILGKNSVLNTNYYPLRNFYKHNNLLLHKYFDITNG